MKTILALIASLFMACNPFSVQPQSDDEGGIEWYSDYPLSITYKIDKAYYAGKDTILYVSDPVITYYSDKVIGSATVTITHEGITYPVDCTVHGTQVRVFNDVIYGAGPDIVFNDSDILRFYIVAYNWGDR